ncbi:MAG TPA: MOP flippase family protein [Baekduia sp.]|uniref:MOP flippase family protein n=1 Tax=Baekduia sp. TaxID=2600305 RepID=UPI002BE64B84|nr:MOP flippase family protein [Baekduia sp.]HMJ33985.1 MOP flippase family protein [Baekduia sp.]
MSGSTSLRGQVFRGLAWKVLSQIVGQGSRLVVAVVLARMLAPRDFGLAAMVLVFSSLVMVFSDLALGAALVQRKKLTEQDRATAFWTSVCAGVTFTLLGMAVAAPLASFYGESTVRGLVMALSTTFLIASMATTHEALLVREMQFRAVELRKMFGLLAGAAAGVVTAAQGGGAWAIIAQQVVTALVTTILIVQCSPWRPSLHFSRRSLRDLGSFSGFVMGHRLLYYLHRNADNLLIGRFVGAAALGVYALAYNVMLIPFSRIAGPVQQVMFPAFSRLQDQPERIADLWIRATRIVGAISVPALCGLVVVAPDFVPVVFGDRWKEAVPLIQTLAWVGLLQSLQTLNTEILQARDRTSTIFRFSVTFFIAHVTSFVIGLHWGVEGVAAAYAISSTLVEPVFTWLTARSLGISVWRLPQALAGIVLSSVLMGGVVYVLRSGLVDAGVGQLPRFLLCATVGVVVYLPLCALLQPELRGEARWLRSLVERRRGRALTAEATA